MSKKKNWYTNPRKYHFIYKTTCQVNGKYYYGMHSTDDLEDGYIGSGTRLWHSIKKYGRENFQMEILEFCSDREALKQREAELVTEEMLSDPMCMNLKYGGDGGWTYRQTNDARLKLSIESFNRMREGWIKGGSKSFTNYHRKIDSGEIKNHWIGKHHTDETKSKISASNKGKPASPGMKGKQHTDETKEKLREKRKIQTNNEQKLGRVHWINNNAQNKRVREAYLYVFLNEGWNLGRIKKNASRK